MDRLRRAMHLPVAGRGTRRQRPVPLRCWLSRRKFADDVRAASSSSSIGCGMREVRVQEGTDQSDARHHSRSRLSRFGSTGSANRSTPYVAARPVQAGDKASLTGSLPVVNTMGLSRSPPSPLRLRHLRRPRGQSHPLVDQFIRHRLAADCRRPAPSDIRRQRSGLRR